MIPLLSPQPFGLSLLKRLAIRLSPQAGKSLVMSKPMLRTHSPFYKLRANGKPDS